MPDRPNESGETPLDPPEGVGGGGGPIGEDAIFTGGRPIGGLGSIFNIGGAPIAVLGGVFSGGLPIGGPVTQIFRGGSGPQPNTLFLNTISPGGPIAAFFIGAQGAPIGVDTFGGGGLAIGLPQAAAIVVQQIQPRTALVTEPAVAFGGAVADPPAAPIGIADSGVGTGGTPIGGSGTRVEV